MITDVEWLKLAMRLFGFILPGAMRVYPTTEAAKPRLWITQAS